MPAGEDPHRPGHPTSARLHNSLGGGWNCTAADQAKAAELEAICPPIRQMGADSRLFAARTVTWAVAELGISQVIDLGAGLPAGEAVHDMARAVNPDARVAYVDHDLEVCALLRHGTLGGGKPGVAVVHADLRDVAAVEAGLREVIDPAEPVLILAALVLHLMDSGEAEKAVRGYAERVAPGSCVAVSVPRVGDAGMWAALREANPVPAWNHGPADLARFLTGLEVVAPGVRAAFALRPGQWEASCRRKETAFTIAAVGRKR